MEKTASHRILVIEDNPAIRAGFKNILEQEPDLFSGPETSRPDEARAAGGTTGFAVDTVASGTEGLAQALAAAAQGRPYALVFLGVHRPASPADIEATTRICQCDPDIQIIISPAQAGLAWEESISKPGQSDRLVILKYPFDDLEVRRLARALARKREAGQKTRARLGELESMVAARTTELLEANNQLKIEMAERARTENIVRQAQKMEAVGRLAGGIAHDFNNLLTVIQGYVKCLSLEAHQNEKVAEALREIDDATKRAGALTGQLVMLSHKTPLHPKFINLNDLVTQFGARVGGVLGENIRLEVETTNAWLGVCADPAMIEVVWLNLALNARDAMPEGGRLLIFTSEIEVTPDDCAGNAQRIPGRFACVRVADTGCGIAQEMLPHVFEPFFPANESDKRSGLGLASAYGIVKQHRGWIEVESKPGGGTRFDIFLPIEIEMGRSASVGTTFLRRAGGSETILLVEDEKPLARLARALLEHEGYRVLEAGNGTEALSVWNVRRAEIDMVLTDMIMPGGLSGRELAKRLREDRKDLKVVYTTGYSPEEFSRNLKLKDGVNFLPKPYHPDKLVQTIRRCLDSPVLREEE